MDLRLLRMRAAVQDLSPEARRRLACLLYYLESGSLADACRRFAIPQQRFHRVLRRFDTADLSTLEDRSRRQPDRAARAADRRRPATGAVSSRLAARGAILLLCVTLLAALWF